MMNIDEIIDVVNSAPKNPEGTLILEKNRFSHQVIEDFFDKVIGTEKLQIMNALIISENESVSVRGKASLNQEEELSIIILSFGEKDGQVVASLDSTLGDSKQSDFPISSTDFWIKLTNVGKKLTIADEYGFVTSLYHAEIQLDNDETSITMPLSFRNVSSRMWQIDIFEEGKYALNIGSLVKLIGGESLDSFLPQCFTKFLDGISVTGIGAIFDLDNKSFIYFSTSIVVTNGWDITSEVRLQEGLQIQLILLEPSSKYYKQFIGRVLGTFKIKDTEIPIFIEADVGNKNLVSFGLQPEKKVTLPSFSSLLEFAGGKDLVNSLPEVLSRIPPIAINRLKIDIDTSKNSLNHVGFAVSTASNWPVVKGYFEITNIYASFDISNDVNNNNKKVVQGKLRGIFDICQIYIQCEIEKKADDNDWSIIGTLPPEKTLNLTQIASKMFEGKLQVPDNGKDFTFDYIEIMVDLKSKEITFSSTSNESWNFMQVEKEAVILKNFHLDFNRKSGVISGSISTTIDIGTIANPVEVSLSAKLDKTYEGSGWFFEGNIKNVNIGDFISFLGSKFNIEVPAPIKSLTLNNLDIGISTGILKFSFFCDGEFEVEDQSVKMSVKINIWKNEYKSYEAQFTGTLSIGNLEFDVEFNMIDKTSETFIATYSHNPEKDESISLHEIINDISPNLAESVPSSLKIDFNNVKFVFLKNNDTKEKKFSLGFDLESSLNLSELPLLGNKLCVKKLSVIYASKPFDQRQILKINELLPNDKEINKFPGDGLKGGLYTSADIQLGENTQKIELPLVEESKSCNTGNLQLINVANNEEKLSSIKWFNVQKSIGPVSFKKIGVAYENNALWILLEASLSLAGLNINADGMGFGSPLDKFKMKFKLNGIGVDYKQQVVEIGGSFLSTELKSNSELVFEYSGDAVIKIQNLCIDAIGSYAQMKSGHSSMFIFAHIAEPIGGPPAFFLTGLAAGFGYNRNIEIPAMNEVYEFPLLKFMDDKRKDLDIMSVVKELEGKEPNKKPWIKPCEGEFWLAAGVEFWSFQLVHTRVMLIAKFGRELEMVVMGLSSIKLPQDGDETYAYAELQLEAVWKPSDNFFGLTALLTPTSFLIDPQCHLTGGFAFYLWYEGKHKGEFVVTLGGYHPRFIIPEYYPKVPPLGINWAVSKFVQIRGNAYFALTPGSIMAGGNLEILFQDGNLKAWFTAQANMLMAFKPFNFLADISVSIGVSYQLHLLFTTKILSVELAASLRLWGPPTGGEIHIKWYIISFTITFGASKSIQDNKPIEWNEFKALIPNLDSICKIQINEGLTKSSNKVKDSDGKAWVVRGDEFSFSTLSLIPTSNFSYDGNEEIDCINKQNTASINIRPMDKSNIKSIQYITILKDGEKIDISGWSKVPYNYKLPSALWGSPLKDTSGAFMRNPSVPNNDIVEVPVGLKITPPPPTLKNSKTKIPFELLGFTGDLNKEMPLNTKATPSKDFIPEIKSNTIILIKDIMGDTKNNRDSIYRILKKYDIYNGENNSLDNMAKNAGHMFTDMIMQV